MGVWYRVRRLGCRVGQAIMNEDAHAKQRWESVLEWYEDFVLARGKEGVRPVVELTRWASTQDWQPSLFPGTSLYSLCVHLKRGYNPDLPFFACTARTDGKITFRFYNAVAMLEEEAIAKAEDAIEVFRRFTKKLQAMQ